LSCAALHCFPDIINGRKRRKTATNNAKKMATAAPMCIRTVYASEAITARGAKDRLCNVIVPTWLCNAQCVPCDRSSSQST
jgi:hypothetical protein